MKLTELILLRDNGFVEKENGCPVIITGGITCSVKAYNTSEDIQKMLNEGFEYNQDRLLPTIPNGFYLGPKFCRDIRKDEHSVIEQHYTLVRYEKRDVNI